MAEKKAKELPEWAQFIIGQALAEIQSEKDIQRVTWKVEGTAVGFNPEMMKTFLKLVEMKRPLLKRKLKETV
jgi:hypothetical protein